MQIIRQNINIKICSKTKENHYITLTVNLVEQIFIWIPESLLTPHIHHSFFANDNIKANYFENMFDNLGDFANKIISHNMLDKKTSGSLIEILESVDLNKFKEWSNGFEENRKYQPKFLILDNEVDFKKKWNEKRKYKLLENYEDFFGWETTFIGIPYLYRKEPSLHEYQKDLIKCINNVKEELMTTDVIISSFSKNSSESHKFKPIPTKMKNMLFEAIATLKSHTVFLGKYLCLMHF